MSNFVIFAILFGAKETFANNENVTGAGTWFSIIPWLNNVTWFGSSNGIFQPSDNATVNNNVSNNSEIANNISFLSSLILSSSYLTWLTNETQRLPFVLLSPSSSSARNTGAGESSLTLSGHLSPNNNKGLFLSICNNSAINVTDTELMCGNKANHRGTTSPPLFINKTIASNEQLISSIYNINNNSVNHDKLSYGNANGNITADTRCFSDNSASNSSRNRISVEIPVLCLNSNNNNNNNIHNNNNINNNNNNDNDNINNNMAATYIPNRQQPIDLSSPTTDDVVLTDTVSINVTSTDVVSKDAGVTTESTVNCTNIWPYTVVKNGSGISPYSIENKQHTIMTPSTVIVGGVSKNIVTITAIIDSNTGTTNTTSSVPVTVEGNTTFYSHQSEGTTPSSFESPPVESIESSINNGSYNNNDSLSNDDFSKLSNFLLDSDDFNVDLDNALAEIRRELRDADETEVDIPDVYRDFQVNDYYVNMRGSFEGSQGTFADISTVRRTGPCSLTQTAEDSVSFNVSLGFDTVRLHYRRFNLTFCNVKVNGEITVDVKSNSLTMVATGRQNQDGTCSLSLDAIELRQLSGFETHSVVLGKMRSAVVNMVANRLLNYFEDRAKRRMQTELYNRLQKYFLHRKFCKF